MTITYRDAVPADAAALVELGRATFIETFGHLYRPEDLAAFLLNHNEDGWREQLSSPSYATRIVEADGAAIGYAKVAPVKLPVEIHEPSIELHQLYVLKPWHGSGVARALMAWVLDEARRQHARTLYLSVYSENHRARRFYEGYGFRFVADYAFMVGNQADADCILRLSLEETS
jgi:ribosomal protein S18 acetylase RimI-like enzyme